MNQQELNKILDLHKKWLEGEEGGEKAILLGADLHYTNLQGANLRRAYLRGADLRYANLEGADLEGADLRGADLSGANLYRADLEGADLEGADLRGADLRYANLEGADLEGADLRGADLDFSCLPLWCGSFNIKVDKKIFDQLCYHICKLNVEGRKVIQRQLKKYANKSHIIERHDLEEIE